MFLLGCIYLLLYFENSVSTESLPLRSWESLQKRRRKGCFLFILELGRENHSLLSDGSICYYNMIESFLLMHKDKILC